MNSWLKKTGSSIVSSAVGVALTGAFGFLAFSGSYNSPSVNVENTSQSKAETYSAQTTTVTEIYSFEHFKKATIDEYDMTVSNTGGKSSGQDKKSSEVTQFTVPFPTDKVNAADVKNSPLGFYATRSIASEYYTVNDIISGGYVTLDGHEMICRMVNSEIGDSWGNEAIKAQAVAAYSYLRFNDAIGAVPTVGLKAGYSSKLESCVNAVEGQTVMYHGKIINAVYSASTAGYSTTSRDVWGCSYPYLQCVKSEFDSSDPNWGIEKKISREKVKSVLEKHTGLTLSDKPEKWFTITSAHSGKYIGSVVIDGNPKCTLSGITLCNLFGVKSNAMDISYNNGVFTFRSYGWGHGVGMSQWGACLYARKGWTYDQILTHYYLGTTIGLSGVNSKAVERASKTQEEIQKEAEASAHTIDDSTAPADSVSASETAPLETTAVTKETETIPETTDSSTSEISVPENNTESKASDSSSQEEDSSVQQTDENNDINADNENTEG